MESSDIQKHLLLSIDLNSVIQRGNSWKASSVHKYLPGNSIRGQDSDEDSITLITDIEIVILRQSISIERIVLNLGYPELVKIGYIVFLDGARVVGNEQVIIIDLHPEL